MYTSFREADKNIKFSLLKDILKIFQSFMSQQLIAMMVFP